MLGSTVPLCPHGWLLTCLVGCNLNAIKSFGFPDWTPIGFLMRWSKARFSKWYQSKDMDLQCLAAHSYIKMLGKFIIG